MFNINSYNIFHRFEVNCVADATLWKKNNCEIIVPKFIQIIWWSENCIKINSRKEFVVSFIFSVAGFPPDCSRIFKPHKRRLKYEHHIDGSKTAKRCLKCFSLGRVSSSDPGAGLPLTTSKKQWCNWKDGCCKPDVGRNKVQVKLLLCSSHYFKLGLCCIVLAKWRRRVLLLLLLQPQLQYYLQLPRCIWGSGGSARPRHSSVCLWVTWLSWHAFDGDGGEVRAATLACCDWN